MNVQLLLIVIASLLLGNSAVAQQKSYFETEGNRGAAQWRSVQGKMLFQGRHDFTNSWIKTKGAIYSQSRRVHLQYWKNPPRITSNYKAEPTHAWQDVAPDINVKLGEITVTGPGWVALAQKRYRSYSDGWFGPQLYLWKEKRPFAPIRDGASITEYFRTKLVSDLETYDEGANWPAQPSWKKGVTRFTKWPANRSPGGEGFIKAGQTLTFEVIVHNKAAARCYPSRIEFELWFFPYKGDNPTRYYNRPHVGETPQTNPGAATLAPVADTHTYAYSYAGWNRANWGQFQNLAAGWDPSGGEKRTYLKFNLERAPKSFNKAILRLYQYHVNGSNGVDLGAHLVTAPWNEGRGTYKPATPSQAGELTWMSQPQFQATPSVTFNPGAKTKTWIEVDLTPLIRKWQAGAPNHGLVLKAQGTLGGNTRQSFYNFRSKEYKDASLHPQLVFQ